MADYDLWCYIEGDDTFFPVTAPLAISISALKFLIHAEKSNLLQGVDPSSFILSKVRQF